MTSTCPLLKQRRTPERLLGRDLAVWKRSVFGAEITDAPQYPAEPVPTAENAGSPRFGTGSNSQPRNGLYTMVRQ